VIWPQVMWTISIPVDAFPSLEKFDSKNSACLFRTKCTLTGSQRMVLLRQCRHSDFDFGLGGLACQKWLNRVGGGKAWEEETPSCDMNNIYVYRFHKDDPHEGRIQMCEWYAV
jgi:hypothetical protein